MITTAAQFKQTEIGLIPEDWKVLIFNDFSDKLKKWSITGGPFGSNLKTNDYTSDGIQIIQLQNIGDGKFINDSKVYTSTQKANELLSCNIYPGEIILSKMGDPVARACIIPNHEERFLMASDGIRLVVDSKQYDNKFVFHYINSPFFRNRAIEISTGSTRQRIGLPELKCLKVIKPPLPEQQAIAEALSDADAWIESLEKLIAKKRLMKQGAMQELLTPKEDWEVKKLGEVGKCLRGVSYSGDTDLSENENEYTIKLLRSNNVYNSKVVFENIQNVNALKVKNQQIIMPNDVLICMANGSKDLVGKAGFCNNSFDKNKYTFGAFMGIFRLFENVNPYFIYLNFLTKNYRNYIDLLLSGSSINNLKPSDIESIEFRLPSKLEQTRIATILSDMDTELEALEKQLEKARQIKQGMMQELLTGRIRLV